MISKVQPKTKKISRIRLWHRFYVLWPRQIQISGEIGTYWVWNQTLLRRWSATYRKYEWARVGQVAEGTR
ncbi:MAG: hypothetical protein C0429_06850 [Sphingopyxis sp.]|nr:hypothetical protein [Sphingopyxis sp.]